MSSAIPGTFKIKLCSLASSLKPQDLWINGKSFLNSAIEVRFVSGSKYTAKLDVLNGVTVPLDDHDHGWFGFNRRIATFGPASTGVPGRIQLSLFCPGLLKRVPRTWLTGHLAFFPNLPFADDPPVVGVWGAEQHGPHPSPKGRPGHGRPRRPAAR